MKRDEVFPSKFLKADDLLNDKGQSIARRVTVINIEDIKYQDGKTQRLLTFKESDKKLGLNKTNWEDLARISGQDPEDRDCDDERYVGLKFEVYRAMVQFGKDTVPAVRVRPVGGWPQPIVEEAEEAQEPQEPQEPGSGSTDEELPF